MQTTCPTKIIITAEREVLPEMYLNDAVATAVWLKLGLSQPVVDDGWEPDIPGPDPRRFMPKSSHL